MKHRDILLTIPVILIIAVLFFYYGYLLGMEKGEQQSHERVLNEYFMLKDDYPHVYRKGYMKLPQDQRDSLYLDAINKLK